MTKFSECNRKSNIMQVGFCCGKNCGLFFRAGNSVYLGSGAASQKKSRSQKPKKKGKEETRSEKKREERSRKRGVKYGREQKKYKSPTKPGSYLISNAQYAGGSLV